MRRADPFRRRLGKVLVSPGPELRPETKTFVCERGGMDQDRGLRRGTYRRLVVEVRV